MTMSKFVPAIYPWNQELWQGLTLEPERSNHALLFVGNEGLGKRDLAFALMHYLMCDNHSQSETLFQAGSHPDLHVIMPEVLVHQYLEQESIVGQFGQRYLEPHSGKPRKGITIDQVRKLSEALTTHPHISPIRIVVIVDAEAMNSNAANALLKKLEEPPANTLFILVSNELDKLAKTIRSRCSLVNFRAPSQELADAWLQQQNKIENSEINNYLAMANNHPLLAIRLFNDGYIDKLKTIFTDVNGLWSSKIDPVQAAKNWHQLGSLVSIEILQKFVIDILRQQLSRNAKLSENSVFFPIQLSWFASIAGKLSQTRLLAIVDELNYAKKMLSTTVDELLVLESVSSKLKQLPM